MICREDWGASGEQPVNGALGTTQRRAEYGSHLTWGPETAPCGEGLCTARLTGRHCVYKIQVTEGCQGSL